MVSVERCLAYQLLPTEGASAPPPVPPPPSWPAYGDVQFDSVTVRYREGLPDVLSGVSFHVLPGQKVRGTQ